MSNVLTNWRNAMEALCIATFPPPVDVQSEIYPGEWDTVSNDKDRIRLFTLPLRAAPNVNNANPRMVIRYFLELPKASAVATQVPRDPDAIEQKMLDLAAMFKAHLTSVGGMDYYHVDEIAQDRDRYAIECSLTAWTRNPAESGG